jgi:hypothetical protein
MQNDTTFSPQDNKKLNRLFKLIVLFTVTGFMIILANTAAPDWVHQYTHNNGLLKLCLSVLLFGIFGSLNACLFLVSRRVKSH